VQSIAQAVDASGGVQALGAKVNASLIASLTSGANGNPEFANDPSARAQYLSTFGTQVAGDAPLGYFVEYLAPLHYAPLLFGVAWFFTQLAWLVLRIAIELVKRATRPLWASARFQQLVSRGRSWLDARRERRPRPA
jgi:hypothetical protein